ncbi:hypothetical protein A6R68_11100 [Neotoma lepida]|uniref:VHS domain-containing protein n=1 Tax=Neotoma lepida TaxID=56216 RepID=A0A1A6FW52_NEOLE|nr:hypothetical protein A6R68_11100 [Neotoma lepida]
MVQMPFLKIDKGLRAPYSRRNIKQFLSNFTEKATDGSLQSEDWTLNMEICDIINETEEGPKDAIRALKKRLSGNRNYREVMLALTNCGHRFHLLVANRDFIDSVLVKIISPKNNPPTIVQDKVLALIQTCSILPQFHVHSHSLFQD